MIRGEQLNVAIAACTYGVPLAMDAPTTSQNVGFNGSNGLEIKCAGTYELTFFVNFRFSADSHLVFYVKANGRQLPETVAALDVQANRSYSFSRTVIVRLCAGTWLMPVVDNLYPYFTAQTQAQGCVTPPGNGILTIPGRGAHLQVRRIGAY